MKRRQIGGRLLDHACTNLNKLVARESRESTCRTLELDGWDNAPL